MPRIARILPPNSVYHIVCRGNNQQVVFKSERDFLSYLSLIEKLKNEHPFNLYHYCLMNNHVHLLLETCRETDLSAFMKRLNLTYFYHFKRNYGFSGHLWQDRYKSYLVEKDNYLLACGKYIELNPVRAKLVRNPEDYQFSSYRFYIKKAKDKLISPDPLYLDLSANEEKRAEFYQEFVISKEYQERFTGPFWGPQDFISKMKKRLDYKIKRGKVSFRKIKEKTRTVP